MIARLLEQAYKVQDSEMMRGAGVGLWLAATEDEVGA